jgi:hypothetical protein
MKRCFDAVAVSVCVLLTVGGCQKSEAGGQKKLADIGQRTEVKAAAAVGEQNITGGTPVPQTSAPAPAPKAAKPVGDGGQIKFEKTVYDFGDIKPDVKNTASYKFTNVGKGHLKILDIQKTCGCTVPELAKRDYAPGESGEIKVEYHASKQGGAVIKHLFVMTDDPNNLRVEITVKGNVIVPVEFEPKILQLMLDMSDANAPTVTIYSKDGKPFSIKSVESNNAVTALTDPNEKATRFVVRLTLNREQLKDNLNGTIRFNLTHPDMDVVVVTYTTTPEFDIQPSSLIIRSATAGQVEKREIWVKNNYGKSFEIESVSSKNGYIKAVKQEKGDNMYKLAIEITPPELDKLMFFSDTLMIKIKNGQAIELACRGFFKRK